MGGYQRDCIATWVDMHPPPLATASVAKSAGWPKLLVVIGGLRFLRSN
jgi:hypothetical protein